MANLGIDSGSDARGLAPGVYLRERGPTPGTETATGIPLFVGFVESPTVAGGESNEDGPKPVRLASWEQFGQMVGHPRAGSFLGYAVRGFFENGGRRCVVLPLSVPEKAGTTTESLARVLRRVFQPEMYRLDQKGLREVLDDIDEVASADKEKSERPPKPAQKPGGANNTRQTGKR